MATNPLVSSPSFLNQIETNNYSPDEFACIIDGKIAPRFESLSPVKKEYVLSLWKHGQPEMAQRTAGCYRSGSVNKVCNRGKYAHGFKFRCGDIGCHSCSRPGVRLGTWSATRDHAIFSAPCVGIEFFLDGANRLQLIAMVRIFIQEYIHDSALMVDAIYSSTDSCGVRAVIPIPSVDRKRLQRLWPGKMSVRNQDSAETYLWAFSGMTSLHGLDPDDKAHLRIMLKGEHLVRTIGDYYAPLSPEQLAELKSHPETTCPACGDHDLTEIPPEMRHQEPVEDIEAKYERVEWGSEVVRKDTITNKFTQAYRVHSTMTALSASPPI